MMQGDRERFGTRYFSLQLARVTLLWWFIAMKDVVFIFVVFYLCWGFLKLRGFASSIKRFVHGRVCFRQDEQKLLKEKRLISKPAEFE